MKSFIYITLLLIISILSRDGVIILCSDDGFKDEQCMKREVLGSNTFKWVKKCKGAQVCVDLPYYGGMIGACSIKVRSHYDGESCANDNKCTSGVCGGTKCNGKIEGDNCEVGLGQCKKGLLCRKKDKNAKYTTCQAPLNDGADCSELYGLVENPEYDSNDDDAALNTPVEPFTVDPFNPSLNPCKLGSVCDGTCKKIASVDAGSTVKNTLACKSGYAKMTDNIPLTFTCVDLNSLSDANKPSEKTSKGAYVKLDKNYTDMFNEWLSEVADNNMDDEDAIYEAYRYTRNKKKVNKAWFIYTHYGEVIDTDDCTFDYLWKNNNGNTLKYSLMIFALILLF
jgi:hypothetical protein